MFVTKAMSLTFFGQVLILYYSKVARLSLSVIPILVKTILQG
jgi:hypothetical protein